MAKEVSKRCLNGINRINSTKENKLKFKDFAGLKTGGIDKYSRAKAEVLEEELPKETVDFLRGEFPTDTDSEKEYVSALRWAARGLLPNHAARKVKTDCEIANNAIGVNKSWKDWGDY